MIDPFERTVAVYRPGAEPEVLQQPETVHSEGPATGFLLSAARIWAMEQV